MAVQGPLVVGRVHRAPAALLVLKRGDVVGVMGVVVSSVVRVRGRGVHALVGSHAKVHVPHGVAVHASSSAAAVPLQQVAHGHPRVARAPAARARGQPLFDFNQDFTFSPPPSLLHSSTPSLFPSLCYLPFPEARAGAPERTRRLFAQRR